MDARIDRELAQAHAQHAALLAAVANRTRAPPTPGADPRYILHVRECHTRLLLAQAQASLAPAAAANKALAALADMHSAVVAAADIVTDPCDASVVEQVLAARLLTADALANTLTRQIAGASAQFQGLQGHFAVLGDVVAALVEDASAWAPPRSSKCKPRRSTLGGSSSKSRPGSDANSVGSVLRSRVDDLYEKEAMIHALDARISHALAGIREVPALLAPVASYASAAHLDFGSAVANMSHPEPSGSPGSVPSSEFDLYSILDPTILAADAEGGYLNVEEEDSADDDNAGSKSNDDDAADDAASSSSSSSSSSDRGPKETVLLPAAPFGASRVKFVEAVEGPMPPGPRPASPSKGARPLRSILKSRAARPSSSVTLAPAPAFAPASAPVPAPAPTPASSSSDEIYSNSSLYSSPLSPSHDSSLSLLLSSDIDLSSSEVSLSPSYGSTSGAPVSSASVSSSPLSSSEASPPHPVTQPPPPAQPQPQPQPQPKPKASSAGSLQPTKRKVIRRKVRVRIKPRGRHSSRKSSGS